MLKALKKFLSDPVFAKKKAFLRELSLFQGLSDRELGFVLQSFHSRSYEEGEALFLENDIGRALFILESGKVELTKKDAHGNQQRLALLGPGEFFGEMALLEQLPRSASAVALEKSQVHLLYRSRLDQLLTSHPHIGACIMRHMSQLLSARLRHTTQALAMSETNADPAAR